MLAKPDRVEKLLCCPRTHAPLQRNGSGLVSADGSLRYELVNDKPLLVDFDESVLRREDVLASSGQSPVRRSRFGKLAAIPKRMVSPEYPATRKNVAKLVARFPKEQEVTVLSVGGGTVGQGMGELFDRPNMQIVAFDIYDSPGTHFIADAHAIPLRDGSVDLVIIQAVLEHVLEPQKVVDEIWRVLAPGGMVYAETPFLQHVHEGAYDFTRFTESGHRQLFRRFELEDSGVVGGPGTQLLWSIDYFARGLFRSRKAGKAFKLGFFWLHFFDRLIPRDYASDAASGLYFMGRKSDHAAAPRDVIAFYPGAGG